MEGETSGLGGASPAEKFGTAVRGFSSRMSKVTTSDLERPTPCTEWSVRDLINHVTGEMRWMPPLLDGLTIAQVGDSLDGDHVGSDPHTAWAQAAEAAEKAVAAPRDPQQLVHLSYGDVPAPGYVTEVAIDVLVHTWDLARAVGADEHLDGELVEYALAQLEGRADMLAASGLFAAPIPVGPEADPQTRLLAAVGRR